MSAPRAAANWGFPTDIWFGAGRVRDLHKAVRSLGGERPLVVTDRGLAAQPFFLSACDALRQAGLPVEVFSDVKPNPTDANIDAGLRALRAGRYDLIIAFGGGSGMDAAKTIALMSGQRRPLWDFEDIGDYWTRVDVAGMLPVIAVPTTAGTGSELGRSAVVSHQAVSRKVIIFHPRMLPKLVIMDPELTVDLPAHLTAATGMDAFTHALESFCAPSFHPLAEGLSLQALQMIKDSLPRAFADGADIEAREQMMIASGMACVALQKGLGGVHALAHPLGALYDAHHGLLNAIVLPYVLKFNLPVLSDKMSRLARILDLPQRSPGAVLDWVLGFRSSLNIPNSLAQIGIDTGRRAQIAELAQNDPCAGGNPIPLTAHILGDLFDRAQAGRF